MSIEEIKEKLFDIKDNFKLFKIIFTHPEKIDNYTFAQTRRRNKKDKYFFFFLWILIIIFFMLNLLITDDGINKYLKSIIQTSIIIFVNLPPIITLSLINNKIKKEHKKNFIYCFLSVSIFLSSLQTFLLFLYLHFENYFFYIISLIIGLIRFIWICFYVPIKQRKVEKIRFKIFRVIKTFVTFICTNIIISIITIIFIINNKQNNYKTIFFNDPIFTEVYNETPIVIDYSQKLNEIIQYICIFSQEDLFSSTKKRDLILQKTNICLIENKNLSEHFNSLEYKHTKLLYEPIIKIYNNIEQINDYVNQIQNFDFNKVQKTIEERKKAVEKNQTQIEILQNRLTTHDKELDALILRHNQLKQKLSQLTENSLENDIVETANEVSNLYKDFINYQNESEKLNYEINELANEVTNNLAFYKEMSIEIETLKNNKLILQKMVSLIKQSVELSQQNVNYLSEKNQRYINMRLSTLWL